MQDAQVAHGQEIVVAGQWFEDQGYAAGMLHELHDHPKSVVFFVRVRVYVLRIVLSIGFGTLF